MRKFDFAIGNPAYQAEVENDGDRANPLYDKFMDGAFQIADKVEMITPGRFLFNAGQTPKAWNKKMLSDGHFKVLHYEQKSGNVFPGTDIKGGVAISYRDANKHFGSIGTFTIFNELNETLRKVHSVSSGDYFDAIVSSQGIFRFTDKAFHDFPDISEKSGQGTGSKIVSAIIDKLPHLFIKEDEREAEVDYIKMLVRTSAGRFYRYVEKQYIEDNYFIEKYKVIVPEANGTGAIGEVLSTPLIGEPLVGEPLVGVTDTFLCIGPFENEYEANNCLKYVKTKFARAMLGVNKITQHNPKATWKDVPMQNFAPNSDINWSTSIANIDKQLYKKYGLSQEEIDFIETHVKEMT